MIDRWNPGSKCLRSSIWEANKAGFGKFRFAHVVFPVPEGPIKTRHLNCSVQRNSSKAGQSIPSCSSPSSDLERPLRLFQTNLNLV